MNISSRPHIAVATVVLSFREKARQIRFEQAAAEAAFASFIGSPSQQTNVPDDAPSNTPRIFFTSGTTTIMISQEACQMQIASDLSDLSVFERFKFIVEKVNEFSKLSLIFKSAEQYSSQGFIIDINVPIAGAIELALEEMHSRLVKAKPLGEIASMQILLGYKVNDVFLNFTVSAYETRSGDLTNTQISTEEIRKLKLTEVGIGIKLDINNRPREVDPESKHSLDELLQISHGFLANDFSTIFGIDIA